MRSPKIGLALVFAIVMTSQIPATLDVIRYLRGDYPGRPVALGEPWPTVVRLIDAAKQDGLRAGDRAVEIEGRVPRGRKDLQQPIREKKPGQPALSGEIFK